MKAQPGPSDSGRYLAPNAPLLWTKLIPASRVMSVRRIFSAGCATATQLTSKQTIESKSACENDLERCRAICTTLSGQRRFECRGFVGRRGHGSRCERNRVVLMDGLPLVIVFRMLFAIRTGNRLSSFVGFEAQVQGPLLLCILCLAQSLIAEHQVVMRLQVFRIDRHHFLELRNSLVILSLQEEKPAQIIQGDTITW